MTWNGPLRTAIGSGSMTVTRNHECADVTRQFLARVIDNTTFHHAEHVRVAFDLLHEHDLINAASLYAKGIRTDLPPPKFPLSDVESAQRKSSPHCERVQSLGSSPELRPFPR